MKITSACYDGGTQNGIEVILQVKLDPHRDGEWHLKYALISREMN